VWENWLPLFTARGHFPLALDLRGHGASEGSYREARLHDYVDDVARVVSDLDEPPILVGHSLGALLIQHLMAERTYPAAVLVASIPGRYPPQVMLRYGLRHPLIMAQANARRDLLALVKTTSRVRETFFTEQTPEDVVVNCHSRITGAAPALFREMVRTVPDSPKPGTPTLVVAPREDRSFTVELQRRLAERLRADFAEVGGSGHDIPLDRSWRAAAELVLDWLDDRVAGSQPTDSSVDAPYEARTSSRTP
jgi:pimeloyl-ACP methyl ester carboxylesterase